MSRSIFDKRYNSNVLVLSMFEAAPWPADYEVVTTSTLPKGASGIHKPELSPFILGPVGTPDGVVFHTVENLWQYSKVYPQHLQSNAKSQFAGPSDDWFAWHNSGAKLTRSSKARPFGKDVAPVYHFWKDRFLSKVMARKLIYAPAYVDAVINTAEYKELKRRHRAGERIILRCWDGYSIWNTYTNLFDVINNPDKKFGHAFVLAMMLEYGPGFPKGLLL